MVIKYILFDLQKNQNHIRKDNWTRITMVYGSKTSVVKSEVISYSDLKISDKTCAGYCISLVNLFGIFESTISSPIGITFGPKLFFAPGKVQKIFGKTKITWELFPFYVYSYKIALILIDNNKKTTKRRILFIFI